MHSKHKRRSYSDAERFYLSDAVKTGNPEIQIATSRLSAGNRNTPFFRRLNEIIAEVTEYEGVRCLKCKSILIVEHKTTKTEHRDKPAQYANYTPGTIQISSVSLREERQVETTTWTCCHCLHATSLSQESEWRETPIRVYTSTSTGIDVIFNTGTSTGSNYTYTTGTGDPYWNSFINISD